MSKRSPAIPSPRSPARAVALRIEHLENPLGLDERRPRFSWQMSDPRRGARQTAYELRVGSAPGLADVWSSGRVRGDNSQLVPFAGPDLVPHTRYFWSVRIWDHEGQPSPWAEAEWLTGFLGRPWPGQWIGLPVRDRNRSTPPRYLRCTFELPAAPRSAWLHVAALGNFEPHLNGVRIGRDVLAPGWTDYRHRTEYLTYDVTTHLTTGRNALGLLLADGWYSGRLAWHGQRRLYGETPAVRAVLRVVHADGSVTTVSSDRRWKATTGALLAADLYDGEVFDARLEPEGWTTAAFDDSGWRRATVIDVPRLDVVAKHTPPIRVVERLPAVGISEPRPGHHVFDFGQNMVGVVRLKVTAPAGTRVQLRHGEMLQADGMIYTANLRGAQATDVYVCKGGGPETYTPRFTFHGFRYVELTGVPSAPTLDTVEGLALHSDLRPTGSFACSDRWINRLQQNIRWGQRGNYLDLPMDCPQRDERLGWTGDAQIFLGTAAYNYDIASFFGKWLRDLRDGQHANGSVPDVAPDVLTPAIADKPHVWPAHAHDGNAGWGDAMVICPWLIYQRYGDARVLEENLEAMKRWVRFMIRTSRNFIRPATAYGDWLATDAVTPFRAPTPNDLVGTAYLAYSTGLVARAADVIGNRADARAFAGLQRRIVSAFQREYVTASGRVLGDTQTAYLLALAFDLLRPGMRARAIGRLVELIERNGDRLATGFIGTPLLCPVLTRFGRSDVAYRLLFQREYPSWLYPVRNDATTMWERWNSWTRETGFGDVGMNSFNHYAYGAVGEWLFAAVGGIELDPRSPGFKRFRLRPAPTARLTRAEARFASPHGEIRSAWRLHRGRFEWQIVIPPNSDAVVHVPVRSLRGVLLDGQPVAKSARSLAPHTQFVLPAGSYEIKANEPLILEP